MQWRVSFATMTQYFYGVGLIVFLPVSLLAQPIVIDAFVEAEIPEEIMETEIILEARSPIDGQPLTSAEYAQLQDELRIPRGEVPGRVSPKIHRALVLLRLRKVLSTIFPFLF